MGVPAEAGDEPSAEDAPTAAAAGVVPHRAAAAADRCIPTTAGGDGRGRMNISYAVDS